MQPGKRRRAAIAAAAGLLVLILVAVALATRDGQDDPAQTSPKTSTTTATPSDGPTTSAAAPTTTAAPASTLAPTIPLPPTSVPADDPGDANEAIVSQCEAGDEMACYEVGRLQLPPPSVIDTSNRWSQAPDDDVTVGCLDDRDVSACYEAGYRNLAIGD